MTSVVGKLFHRILAERLEAFLLQNGLVNPEVQKGFISGISGSIDHEHCQGLLRMPKVRVNPFISPFLISAMPSGPSLIASLMMF